MKRQDVSGVERLAVDSTGGGVGSDVNVTGINGTAPSTGGGASDGGTLRVIVATDSPSSGNPAAGATGIAVPAAADYQGVNVGGTLRGATGVNPSGSIFAEQVDLASIAGATTATGNGVVSAGVQRVAIASDNTAFAVNATLQASAAVIGHVITDTGSTTAVTGNVTVVQGTGTNLHAVIDSGSTTAVTGNVTVVQGTGTNLHAVIDSGSTTAVTGNVTVVQGTGTNLHAVLDAGSAVVGSVELESNTMTAGGTATTPKFAKIAASTNGDNTLVAAVVGKKIRVLGYNFIANGTVNAKFQSGAGGTDLTGLKYCVANMGISVAFSPVGWFETASNTLLNLNLSAGIAVGGELVYVEV